MLHCTFFPPEIFIGRIKLISLPIVKLGVKLLIFDNLLFATTTFLLKVVVEYLDTMKAT